MSIYFQIHVHVDEFYKDKEEFNRMSGYKHKRLFRLIDVQEKKKIYDYLIKKQEQRKVFFFIHWFSTYKNVPESVPEFYSICPRKMSFVPENIPESPRKIWHVWSVSKSGSEVSEAVSKRVREWVTESESDWGWK